MSTHSTSILTLPPRDNTFVALLMTAGLLSRKSSLNYSRLASSEKFFTRSGSPTLCSSERRTLMTGGCVSTTLISTSIALRILSGCRGLIKSLTLWRVVLYSVSWIATPAIIKLQSRNLIKRRPHLSPRLVLIVTQQCPSG